MKVEYELSYADWLIAQRAWYGNRFRVRWMGVVSYLMARWLLLLMAVAAIAIATVDLLATGTLALRAMVPLLSVGVVWLGIFGWARYWCKQRFIENHGDVLTVELTDRGVNVTRVGKASSEYLWKGILAFLDEQDFLLLYLKKRIFVPIPKRAIPSQDRAVWNELIRQKVSASRP